MTGSWTGSQTNSMGMALVSSWLAAFRNCIFRSARAIVQAAFRYYLILYFLGYILL